MSGGQHEAPKQRRPTRTLILAAAADLASLDGLEQLSLGQLAAGVGLSKSGLYAHFESKEALQLATIGHVREVFEASVLREPPDGRCGGLEVMLDRWLAFYERAGCCPADASW